MNNKKGGLEKKIRVREAELLRNAALLFNKKGYSSTSIRQLCKVIGIRESSVYHYIDKKEDLLYKTCEHSMLMSLKVIEPIAKSTLKSDLKFRKMIEAHIINIM